MRNPKFTSLWLSILVMFASGLLWDSRYAQHLKDSEDNLSHGSRETFERQKLFTDCQPLARHCAKGLVSVFNSHSSLMKEALFLSCT